MYTKNLKNEKGFTIAEMLVYIGLLSVMLIILTELFVSIINLRADLNALNYNEQDGRYIVARLETDINNSQSIINPATNGSTSSVLEISKNGQNIKYELDGDRLKITIGSESYYLNSNQTEIKDLTFKRVGSGKKDTVKIEYTVVSKQIKSGDRAESTTFKLNVGTR